MNHENTISPAYAQHHPFTTGIRLMAVLVLGSAWLSNALAADDDVAALAAALTDDGTKPVSVADVRAMRLDPSFVAPRTALPEDQRNATAMTNTFAITGASDLDVIRADAHKFAGEVSVRTGELTFSLTTETGRTLWTSGPLQAGVTQHFAVNVREPAIVTFSTRGTGSGAWTHLVYTHDRERWPAIRSTFCEMHPLATYRLDQIKDNRDWENPFVFARNREARHATFMPFPTVESACRATARTESTDYLSLNGDWKALFTPHPDKAPRDFFKPGFDDSAWRTVQVPNTSEIVGMGTPIFCAFGYWWMVDPPFVSRPPTSSDWTVTKEPNGTVNYRRAFTLGADWLNRPVKLAFDGFGAAIYVWMNGEAVGYAEDGRPGAEFDVTRFVKSGVNMLAVQVLRLCDGCYLEDQDYFRLSGLFRSVGLVRHPPVHVRDFTVKTTRATPQEPYFGGTWNVDVVAELDGAPGKTHMEAQLYSAQGTCMAKGAALPGKEMSLRIPLKNPNLWSAEEPNLYKLVLILKDSTGRTLEAIPQQVGFREIEKIGATICVNGKAVKFNGVNRHEIAPEAGYTMTDALIERDFRLLKQNNVNAIRLSHYPNGPRFYELANEWGFYILDEANFESHALSEHGWSGFQRRKGYHGVGGARNPAVDPRFRAAAMDRETGMVLRDRNQPCVIFWSLGNEILCHSDFFSAAYDTIKALDSTRPVMNQQNGKQDFRDSMYARPKGLVGYAQGRNVTMPFIPCEYEHTEGNCYGNLIDYGRAFWQYECLQGGFLWDFVDQEFRQKRDPKDVKPGQPDWRWAYGGDFGDKPGHGTGCCNGAFRPDRTPSPGVPEFKYIYQPAHIVASEAAQGTFTITNRLYFTSLSAYELKWTCEDDGRVTAQGSLGRMAVPPHGGATFKLDVPPVPTRTRLRTWNFRWCAPEPTRWCEKGFVCAQDQVTIPEARDGSTETTLLANAVSATEDESGASVTSGDVHWRVSRKTGALISWQVKGREMLSGPLEPCLWRAPITKEKAALGQVRKNWEKAAAKRRVTEWNLAHQPGAVELTVDWAFPTAAETTGRVTYRFTRDLTITFTLEPKGLKKICVSPGFKKPPVPIPPPLARVGMEFRVAKAYDTMNWFGRGPHENYPGRTASAFFGRYALPAAKFFFPYAKPQECGNRSDVYEAYMTDKTGAGFKVTACDRPLNFNVLAYTAYELEKRRHPEELEDCGDWIVHVDGFVRGVDGTGAGLKPDQKLDATGKYTFSFRLTAPLQ